MKMFTRLLFTAAFLLTTACSESPAKPPAGGAPAGAADNTDNKAQADAAPPRKPATAADEPIKYNRVTDPKTGMVQFRSPIPQSWQVHEPNAAVYITSPVGVKVNKSEIVQFAWSPNRFMQQTIQQSGQKLAPPMTLQQILKQQIQPSAKAQGYRFLGSFETPGVQGLWQRLINAMPRNGNQRSIQTLGTQWEAQNGTKSMILLVKWETRSPQSMMWQLQSTELEAPAAHYEAAKTAYLYAVANTELNPEWIAASNKTLQQSTAQIRQFWNQASQVSRNAHQQRMAAINARGAAATSLGKTYSDILDISHKGYLTRDSINNDGHGRIVNAITNTTVIGNHETGEHYNVDGNNKYYWANADGVYIGTDNALFDPRLNKATRDQQWTRFHKER